MGTQKMEHTQVDALQFRNSFIEAIEELRLRRTVSSENEDKIRQLVVDKHMLESKFDEKTRQVTHLEQQHKGTTSDLCRQHREEIKQLQDTKAKLSATCDSHEHEIKALKDEVRVLQMTQYNLEKKLREQEQKVQLEEASRGSTVALVSELDQRCKSLAKTFQGYSQLQDRLQKEVREAQKLNKHLRYSCQHQQCSIHEYREKLSKMKQEMLELHRRLAAQPLEGNEKLTMCLKQLSMARQIFKEKDKVNEILTRQNEALEEECKRLQSSMKDLQALLAKQVEGATKSALEVTSYRQELTQLQSYQAELQAVIAAREEELTQQAMEHGREQEKWMEMEASLREDLDKLQRDHGKLEEACGGLNEQNNVLTSQRNQLQQQLAQAQAELNKPKEDKTTEITIEWVQAECQTVCRWPEVEQCTQTDAATMCQASCQTITVTSHHEGTQTDAQTVQTTAIQTDTKQQQPVACQTQFVSVRSTASQSPAVKVYHIATQVQPNLRHIGIQSSSSAVVAKEDDTQLLRKVSSSGTHSKLSLRKGSPEKVARSDKKQLHVDQGGGSPVLESQPASTADGQEDEHPVGSLLQASPDSVPDSPVTVNKVSEIASPPKHNAGALVVNEVEDVSQLSPYSRFRARLQHIATKSPEYFRGIQELHEDATVSEDMVDPDIPLAQRLLRKTSQLRSQSDIIGKKQMGSRLPCTYSSTTLKSQNREPPGTCGSTHETCDHGTYSYAGILKDPGMHRQKRQKTVHFSADVPMPTTPTPPSSADAASLPNQTSPADGVTTELPQHLPDTDAGGDFYREEDFNNPPKSVLLPMAPRGVGDQMLFSDDEEGTPHDDQTANVQSSVRPNRLRATRHRSSHRNLKPD